MSELVQRMSGLGLAWWILANYEQLRRNFDPNDRVSVRPDSEVSGYVMVRWLFWGGLLAFNLVDW